MEETKPSVQTCHVLLDSLQQICLRHGEEVSYYKQLFQTIESVIVQIENDDLWGHHSVLDSIPPGFVFAETYASLGDEPLMVTVTATRDTEVLFLNVKRLLKTCPNSCAHHSKFIQRLFMVSAQKNLNLSRRIFHTTPKSIRGRLLSYLSFQASAQGSLDFTIPFNRQQLADYLNVERSALSGELGKMQREGLLKTEKNHFTLYEIR